MQNVERNSEAVKARVLRQLRLETGLPAGVLCELAELDGARGTGLHQAGFKVACQLNAWLYPDDLCALLRLFAPEAQEREVRNWALNSAKYAWQPRRAIEKVRLDLPHTTTNTRATLLPEREPRLTARPKWPEPNLPEIEATCAAGPTLAALRKKSPAVGCDRWRPGGILKRLFPADALLCLALRQNLAVTLPLREWLTYPPDQLQFIVPSPMLARTGQTQDGRDSYRSLNNVGPRRFLVCECDFSEFAKDGKTQTVYTPLIRKLRGSGISARDMCASVLWRLAEQMPLAMVVFSGGKSLHGWFNVQGLPEGVVLRFMRAAVLLGADDATYTPVQLVRLPGGTRVSNAGELGPRQSVEYFNVEALYA